MATKSRPDAFTAFFEELAPRDDGSAGAESLIGSDSPTGRPGLSLVPARELSDEDEYDNAALDDGISLEKAASCYHVKRGR